MEQDGGSRPDVSLGLAGCPFQQVEIDLAEILALPDSPVWAIGNYRGIVSSKDALFAAGAALTQDDVDRFLEVVEFVLSEDDPALDMAPEHRWTANIHGKSREISGAMRAAFGEFLVLLAVDGAQALGSHLRSIGFRVDALVSKMLRNVEARNWLSQRHDLPLLTEASPRAFVEAVEADLRSNDPQLLAMLRPVGAGGFDSPDRTGLLWALETIAWNEAFLFRVGRILARLSEVPIDDNWLNKPENSLVSLIRSWLPQTAADVDQRIGLLDIVAREFPMVGWRMCKSQTDTGQRFASPNSRPRSRPDAAGTGSVTHEEDFRRRRHALDLMLQWPSTLGDQLGDLIELSPDLPPEDQATVWARVNAWIDAGPTDEDRANLRERMRRSVLSRRTQKKGKATKLDKTRRAVFERLAPAGLIERHRWLFAEHWVSESGDEQWEEEFDYKKHESHIDGLRQTAIVEILQHEGMTGIEALLSLVKAWSTIGQYLILTAASEKQMSLVATLVEKAVETGERYWAGCLQGALLAIDDSDRGAFLAALAISQTDAAALTLFKFAPFDGTTWFALAASKGDLEPAYWRQVIPHGWRHADDELNLIVDRLFEVDRPISAFNALAHEYERLDGATLARLIKSLTQPTAEAESGVQIHAHGIEDALEASGAATVAELAQFEYLFVNASAHSKHGIRNLEKQISASPVDFVHLVSILYLRDDGLEDPDDMQGPDRANRQSICEKVYAVLGRLKRTPGTRDDGVVDSTALLSWMVEARDRFKAVGRSDVGDSQIGQLLGRTRADPDGLWPNEAVRDALEACGSDRMMRGMEIGLRNNRGAVWRAPGGGQERALADRYRRFARQVQKDYPVTARMLDSVAEGYEGQAEWHDTDEAVRKRLNRR